MMMKSRYAMIFPLLKKSDVTKAFQQYCHDIKLECGLDVTVLRSDNGGEYRNNEMTRFCQKQTIKQEFTVPYNPEQNGMAERLNRTLVEMTRCMLSEAKMDKTYWCEAMMTAVDIRIFFQAFQVLTQAHSRWCLRRNHAWIKCACLVSRVSHTSQEKSARSWMTQE